MGVLVGQANPEQHARQAEFLLEGGHHRNRSALAIEHRALAEALFNGAAGRLHEWIVERGHPRLAAVHARDLQLHGLRRDLFHVLFKEVANLLRILVGHQSHADLGHGHGWQHGFGALTGEAREQAVHLEGRPRPRAFERGVAGFAKQLRRPQFLLVLFLVEGQLLPLRPLLIPQRHHIVVEAVDLDASALVFHLREHLRQHHRGVGHGATERP